jgi:hypothetical protein
MKLEPEFTDRRWLLGTMLLVGLLAAGVALFLALTSWPSTDTAWCADSGRHYYEGQRVGLDLRNLEFGQALSHLMKRDLWPPLQTILIALAVAAFGADMAVGALLSLSAWVLAVGVVAGVAVRLFQVSMQHPLDGAGARIAAASAGLLAATWFASTPLLLDLAFTAMQEPLSFFFFSLALLFWIEMMHGRQSGDAQASARYAWRCSVLTTLLAFTRYAVWMEWLLAWLVLELIIMPREQRQSLQARLRGFFSRRSPENGPSFWRQPLLLLAAGLLVVWLVNFLFRPLGNNVEVAGRSIHIGVARNMVYWMFVLVVLGTLGLWMRHRKRFVDCWAGLPVVWQALLMAHVVPVGVWFLIPHRLKLFVGTFLARPEDHKKLYSPLTMIRTQLFAVPWTMWIVVAMLMAVVLFWRRIGLTGRRYFILSLLFLIPIIMVPYEERYALPALVPLLPLVAVALTHLLLGTLSRVTGRLGFPLPALVRGLVAVAVSLGLVVSVVLAMPAIIAEGLPRPDNSRPPIGLILRQVVDVAEGQVGPLLILTDTQKLPDSQIKAMFNEHYQRSVPGIVGYIRLEGRPADTILAGTLEDLRPEMIITYETGPGVFVKDSDRVEVLQALRERTDYQLDREIPGVFPQDVVQVLVPVSR